jgi:hypothetical protein
LDQSRLALPIGSNPGKNELAVGLNRAGWRYHQVRRSGASGPAIASSVSRVMKAAQSSGAIPVASGAEMLRMMVKVMAITLGDQRQWDHDGNVTTLRAIKGPFSHGRDVT